MAEVEIAAASNVRVGDNTPGTPSMGAKALLAQLTVEPAEDRWTLPRLLDTSSFRRALNDESGACYRSSG